MIPMTFSCWRCWSSLISRKMRFASTMSSNARGIFLIATFCPVSVLRQEMTTPYAPCPIALMNSYFASTCVVVRGEREGERSHTARERSIVTLGRTVNREPLTTKLCTLESDIDSWE